MPIKTGDTARLIQPVIQGTVKARRINPTTDETELLVEWTDANGDTTERWFDEDTLEAA